MSNSTPMSPPETVPTPPSSSGPSISPVFTRTGTFPHKTSPAVATQTRLIDTTTPAINDAPVELDGMPTTMNDLKRRATDGSSSAGVLSPADEQDIDGEFLGDGESAGKDVREKRAAMLASRSRDPGVIVDVPQFPTAEEVEAAKSADGTITPGLPTPGLPPKSFGGR